MLLSYYNAIPFVQILWSLRNGAFFCNNKIFNTNTRSPQQLNSLVQIIKAYSKRSIGTIHMQYFLCAICFNVKFFDIKFKCKKNLIRFFYVQHRDWNANNGGL
jgi:hypothetical protein